MSAAARDLFDVEHSPLDTGAALSAQAETLLRWQAEAPVAELLRAADEMLTRAWTLAEGRSTALEVEVRIGERQSPRQDQQSLQSQA